MLKIKKTYWFSLLTPLLIWFLCCGYGIDALACQISLRRAVQVCPAVTTDPQDCLGAGLQGKKGDKINEEGAINVLSSGYAYFCIPHETCYNVADLNFVGCRFTKKEREISESEEYLYHITMEDDLDHPGRILRPTIDADKSGIKEPNGKSSEIRPAESKPNGSFGSFLSSNGIQEGRRIDMSSLAKVPQVNPERYCEGLVRMSKQDDAVAPSFISACIDNEQKSYDKLKVMWPDLTESVKINCIQELDHNSNMLGVLALGGEANPNTGQYAQMLICAENAVKAETSVRELEKIKKEKKFHF